MFQSLQFLIFKPPYFLGTHTLSQATKATFLCSSDLSDRNSLHFPSVSFSSLGDGIIIVYWEKYSIDDLQFPCIWQLCTRSPTTGGADSPNFLQNLEWANLSRTKAYPVGPKLHHPFQGWYPQKYPLTNLETQKSVSAIGITLMSTLSHPQPVLNNPNPW